MMSVYIVDDSKVIRDRLARDLNDKLKTVRINTAEKVEDVKQPLIDFLPDVIIVDIHLKEGSGFDVLKYIQEKQLSSLVIVLTNYAIQPYEQKALDLGAHYFFDKSQEFNKAIEVIERYANQS